MRRAVSLLALLVAAACSGATAEQGGKPGSSSTGGAGPGPSTVCGESKLGPPRLRRLSRDELTATLSDIFPELQGAWKSPLSADLLSKHGFDNDAQALVVGKQKADELDRLGGELGLAVSGTALSQVLPCAAASPDSACAASFIAKYGKRLFHRNLTAEESARYIALFEQVSSAKDFARGIYFVTRALVQSPHAVYRREVGTSQEGTYQLAPHELATALAYDFSGTAPSDELLAQAETGQLGTPEALEAAARQLLQSEKGLATVEKFFDAWLGYGRVGSVTKTNVAGFEQLREQMVGETRRFLGEVVVTQGGGLHELLTAPFTTPSAGLAQFYGFPAPTADYAVSQRPAGRGIGILAQGALLSSLSGPTASSPTQRGLLVMERLLCRAVPTVPPDVPDLAAPRPGVQTTRQRYESTHAQGGCKACHDNFDPIGFGFEHFDEAGRYRELEGGLPVDSASYVPGSDGHSFDFANLEELAQGLAAQKLPYECVTGYLSTYVFGAADACLGETKRPAFVAQQAGFIDYLASLAAEPHFRARRLAD